MSIFREYDIRGIFPKEVNESVSLEIGRALGTFLTRKGLRGVVVGRDDRNSSPALSANLIQGLISTGCDVVDIGVSLTPVVHFLTCTRGFDAGVIVTASHNPKEYNGFRIAYKSALPLYGVELLDIEEIMSKQDWGIGQGTDKYANLNQEYVDYFNKFKVARKLKVVINCGSGATSEIAPRIISGLGVQVVPLACAFDSSFPSSIPDPENFDYMRKLADEVVKQKADIGFAFDTDGDRIGVVDEKGTIYFTDRLLMLLASDVLEKHPKGNVVYDVKCSGLVEGVIREAGGLPEMIRTGHCFFVKKMVEEHALLGVEFSGHVYFGDDYYGFDDGVYCAYRLLDILSRKGKSLSDLMEMFPRAVGTPEIKIPCDDKKKKAVVDTVKGMVKNIEGYRNLVELDGVRVELTDTEWFLVRASNTSPYLSLRAEGRSKGELTTVLKAVGSVLEEASVMKASEFDKYVINSMHE